MLLFHVESSGENDWNLPPENNTWKKIWPPEFPPEVYSTTWISTRIKFLHARFFVQNTTLGISTWSSAHHLNFHLKWNLFTQNFFCSKKHLDFHLKLSPPPEFPPERIFPYACVIIPMSIGHFRWNFHLKFTHATWKTPLRCMSHFSLSYR